MSARDASTSIPTGAASQNAINANVAQWLTLKNVRGASGTMGLPPRSTAIRTRDASSSRRLASNRRNAMRVVAKMRAASGAR